MTLLAPLAYKFTSLAEMQRVYSEEAIDFRQDDSIDPDLISEIIDDATYQAKSILNSVFADVDLYRHTWVRRRTTFIACYELSIRRGNPSQYLDQYAEALEQFQALVEGSLTMLDLPRAQYASIVMQNVHTDMRFPFAPVRVDIINSTQSVGREFLMYYLPFAWL